MAGPDRLLRLFRLAAGIHQADESRQRRHVRWLMAALLVTQAGLCLVSLPLLAQ